MSLIVVVVLVSVLFVGIGGARAGTSPFTDFWFGYGPNVRADLNDALSTKKVDSTGNAEIEFAVTADLIDPPGGTTHNYYEIGFQTTLFSHVTGNVGYNLYPGTYNPTYWFNGYTELDLADNGGQWVSFEDWYFPYYGAWYDRVFVSANGFILFGQSGAANTDVETIYTTKTPSTTYPNAADPDGVLAPLWRDLDPYSAGRVGIGWYWISGYETFVVAWENVKNKANNNVQSFAIYLARDNMGGDIKFIYKTLTKDVTTTVGIENPFGTAGMGDYYSLVGTPTPDSMARLEFIPSAYNTWDITDVRIHALKWYGDVGGNDKEAAVTIEGASDLGWGGRNVKLYDPGPSNPPPDFDDRTHRYINRVVDEIIGDVAGADPKGRAGFLWGKYNYVKDLHSILTDYEYTSETTKDEPGRLDTYYAMAENFPENDMNPSDKVFHLWTAPVFKWLLYDDELYTSGGLAAHEHTIAFYAEVQFKKDDGSSFQMLTNCLTFKMGKYGLEGIQNVFYDNFDDGFIEVPTYNPGSLNTWNVIKGSNGYVTISPAGEGYSEDYSLDIDWHAYDWGLARVVSPALPIDFTRDYSIVLYVNMTTLGRAGHLVVMDDGRIEVFIKQIDLEAKLCVATSTGYVVDRTISFDQWQKIVITAFPSEDKFKLYVNSGGGMILYDFKSPTGYNTIGFGSGAVSGGSYDAGEARWDDVAVYGYPIPLPSVTVTSPNGGESWSMGTTGSITWTYANNPGTYVKIDLYKGASLARTIVSSTPCDGSYTWTLPMDLVVGSDYRILICSTTTGAYDFSDGYFSVTAAPTYTVTSPSANILWGMGMSWPISWTWTGSPGGYVKIDLYKSGAFVRTITSSTLNDGSYSWSMPTDLVEDAYYMVKVSSTSYPAIYDYSDYFHICVPSITVMAPFEGEAFPPGSSCRISWLREGINQAGVAIYLYKGATFQYVIATGVIDGYYYWTVPLNQAIGTDYWIRVQAVALSTVYDDTDYFCVMVPWINVTSPVAGDAWEPESSHYITWEYGGIPGGFYVYLYKGDTYQYTICPRTLESSFLWTIPTSQATGTDYRVVVGDHELVVVEYSDYFTIGTVPFITVTSPNGGESWVAGTAQSVTWTYGNSPGSYVKIELYRASTLVSTLTSSTACDGSYTWYPSTSLTPASDYRIKISSTTTAASDYSDAYFTIVGAPKITVISPTSSTIWMLGDYEATMWTSENNPGSYVKIELYKGSTMLLTIISSTANDGYYSWLVPTTLKKGDDYRVKVSSTTTSAYDYSDYFTIKKPGGGGGGGGPPDGPKDKSVVPLIMFEPIDMPELQQSMTLADEAKEVVVVAPTEFG